MQRVLGHIVRKRLSQETENVATEALAYILETSESARNGMNKLLRGIVPDLPPLRFETQQPDGSNRPDMKGLAATETRLFVENKLWAGLTDNQPVSYLNSLAKYPQPSLLLVIGPAKRQQVLQRGLARRVEDAKILGSEPDAVAGVTWLCATTIGPFLALTSWMTVLSALEREAAEDLGARGDLIQLRALCDAADDDAFIPVSAESISDQRTPALILQLVSVATEAIELGVSRRVLSTNGLKTSANPRRIGRHVRVAGGRGPGAWFGVHFELWKSHGMTPLWLKFPDDEFGRARDVWGRIEPWAATAGKLAVKYGNEVAIAFDIAPGEDKTDTIRSLVRDLDVVGELLRGLGSPQDSQPPAEP